MAEALASTRVDRLLATLDHGGEEVNGCALARDGTTLVTAVYPHMVQVWGVRRPGGECLCTLSDGHTKYVLKCTFSPDDDESRLATCSADRTVCIWDTATWTRVRALEGHTAAVYQCKWFPAPARQLVTASLDKTVKVWNTEDGTCVQTLEGHGDKVWDVDVSPDGQCVASASNDKTVKVWRADGGGGGGGSDGGGWACVKTLSNPQGVYMNGCAFSPDGRWLAGASALAAGGHILLWDATSDAYPLVRTFQGHTHGLTKCSFSADSRLLVSTSFDKTVKVWRVADGTCLATMEGHTKRVGTATLSRDGTTIASVSDDGTAKLWDVADLHLRECVAPRLRDLPTTTATTPDGVQTHATRLARLVEEVATMKGLREVKQVVASQLTAWVEGVEGGASGDGDVASPCGATTWEEVVTRAITAHTRETPTNSLRHFIQACLSLVKLLPEQQKRQDRAQYRRKLNAELAAATARHTRAMNAQAARHAEECKAKDAALVAAGTRHAEAMDAQAARHAEECKAKDAALAAANSRHTEAMHAQATRYTATLNAQLAAATALRINGSKLHAASEQALHCRMQDMQASHAQALASQRRNHDNAMAHLQRQHDYTLQEMAEAERQLQIANEAARANKQDVVSNEVAKARQMMQAEYDARLEAQLAAAQARHEQAAEAKAKRVAEVSRQKRRQVCAHISTFLWMLGMCGVLYCVWGWLSPLVAAVMLAPAWKLCILSVCMAALAQWWSGAVEPHALWRAGVRHCTQMWTSTCEWFMPGCMAVSIHAYVRAWYGGHLPSPQ